MQISVYERCSAVLASLHWLRAKATCSALHLHEEIKFLPQGYDVPKTEIT